MNDPIMDLQLFAEAAPGESAAPEAADAAPAAEAAAEAPAAQSAPAAEAAPDPLRQHFDRLCREAADFAREVPGFDLERELESDAFVRLLAPETGLSLADAYFVVHRGELLGAAQRAAEKRLTQSLLASRSRPGPIKSAGTVSAFRWDTATREQREALKQRIRRGERVTPNR